MEKQLHKEHFNDYNGESVTSFINRNKIAREDILQILVSQGGSTISYTLFYYAEKPFRKQ